MQITGKIKQIYQAEQPSATFTKRDFVVTTDETHPQEIIIQMVQDKCSLLDSFQIGQEVKVGINLRGRSWTNPQGEVKYFNTIQGWKIEAVGQQQAPQQQFQQKNQQQFQQAQGGQQFQQNNFQNGNNNGGDLPF